MRRREFIPVIGAVVLWPFVSRAEQTARARRIGVLIGVGLTTRKRRSSAFCRGCSKLFIVLLFAIAALPLLARDRGQFAKSTPEMKAWFDALKSERGRCCSDADGTVVSDVDWDTKDGHYRVRLDGEWIDVPDDASPISAIFATSLWFVVNGSTKPLMRISMDEVHYGYMRKPC